MMLEINSFVGAVLCVCSFQVAKVPYTKSLQWRFWKALVKAFSRAFFLAKLSLDLAQKMLYNAK